MIPTNSTARPHHIKSKNKRNQGRLPKISAAHGNCRRRSRRQEQQAHPSAKPATSAANSRRVYKLETKPPAKTDLKREYLNPKASAANLRQYAANTLPKNPAVADLVQHGEDMKSSLARPLENYFCLGLNLQMTCSTSKNSQARPEKRSNHSGA